MLIYFPLFTIVALRPSLPIRVPVRPVWRFHLLLFVPSSFGSVVEIRDFIASSWYEICGEISDGHLLAGTHVEEIRTWRKATSCVEKYMAKEEQFPEGLETGRIWGV